MLRFEQILVIAVMALLLRMASSQMVNSQRCARVPENRYGRPPPKTPGSNGFEILVIGNHTKYIPNKTYSVKIVGMRTKSFWQKFEGFYLVVEPSGSGGYELNRHERVGRFQLFGEALTRFSDDCPNMVTHTSSAPKTEISVMWVAPPRESGCVVFRATVVEHRDMWYKDEGALSYELCEQLQENQDEQPSPLSACCACDEAKYEVTFEGLWSRHTHPKDFPRHEWDTAFSDVIGASHSADYRFWEYGGRASEGVRQVAEWGDTKKLESELKQHSANVRTIIKARGLEYPNLQSRTFAVFRVDRQHHQASLISRIKPSPDWMVGVAAMELCLRNCSWTQRQVLNLRPWDVGTSNGDSYLSSSSQTMPPQKIQHITSKWPANSPFFDPSGAEMPPLARLIIQRQRVYDRSCPDGSPGGAALTRGFGSSLNSFSARREESVDRRPGCATTAWGRWGACSATCGQGSRSRSRQYLQPTSANVMACSVTLMEYGSCTASQPCGSPSPSSWDQNGGSSYGSGAVGRDMCALTEWSRWTACSSTCGQGTRSRRRRFKNRLGRKRCSQITQESEPCTGAQPVCDAPEYIAPGCEVTTWSEWSPCSVVCGPEGKQVRRRMYMSPNAELSGCNVRLEDVTTCIPNRPSCNLAREEAMEICRQPLEVGSCRSNFNRYYYDPSQERCVQFIFSGCKGNANNFVTLEACSSVCEDAMTNPDVTDGSNSGYGGSSMNAGYGGSSMNTGYGGSSLAREPLDVFGASQVVNPLMTLSSRSQLADPDRCQLSGWSEWSACSATCGHGKQWRHRQPLQSADWSAECQRELTHYRKCSLPAC